jgi:hypothetical protein
MIVKHSSLGITRISVLKRSAQIGNTGLRGGLTLVRSLHPRGEIFLLVF